MRVKVIFGALAALVGVAGFLPTAVANTVATNATSTCPYACAGQNTTAGLCGQNYPSLTPLITTFPRKWTGIGSNSYTAINGIRTCGFSGEHSFKYMCPGTGGNGDGTGFEVIATQNGTVTGRNLYAPVCDGSLLTFGNPYSGLPSGSGVLYHLHWHFNGAYDAFRNAEIDLN